jgi:hypothetical protein
MMTCQAIFVPGLAQCRTGIGIHPVKVASPVISAAYLCDHCLDLMDDDRSD